MGGAAVMIREWAEVYGAGQSGEGRALCALPVPVQSLLCVARLGQSHGQFSGCEGRLSGQEGQSRKHTNHDGWYMVALEMVHGSFRTAAGAFYVLCTCTGTKDTLVHATTDKARCAHWSSTSLVFHFVFLLQK